MKNATLLLFLLFYTTTTYCQSIEISLNVNSGFFSFSGESTASSSFINYNLENERGYTNNPYGSNGALSYGLSTSLTRLAKSNLLIGLDGGYELLRSKVHIDWISISDGITNETIEAEGYTHLNFQFINLFPKIGYRLSISRVKIDFSGGFDFAYCLSANENGTATSETREYNTRIDRKTLNTDIRTRLQANVSKGNYGAYLGYSRGISNYKSEYIGGLNETNGNLLRFGLNYIFN